MSRRLKIIIAFTPLLLIGVISFSIWKSETKNQSASAAISKTGLTLDLNFGNNNGSATPTVYDSSGFNRHATSTAGFTSPTCNAKFCDFSGDVDISTADRMTANMTDVFNSSKQSIAIKFSPDFLIGDANSNDFLFDAGNATVSRTAVYFSVTYMDVILGGVYVARIPVANVQPYWKTGKENILIIRSDADNDDTYIWINGVLILDNGQETWAQTNPTNIIIGCIYVLYNSFSFDGKIHYFKVWNRLLTDAEVGVLSTDRETFTQSPQRASSTPVSGGKLIGHWTMDTNDMSATGATIYDKSGQNNNATMIGTTTSTGKIGQARSFNGTSDYVNVTSLTPNIATNGTASISGWYKFDQTASQKGSSMGLHSQIYQHTANNYFYLTNGADFFNVASVIRVGVWHHIVLTYSGNHSTMVLYIDGVRYNITLQTTSDTLVMSSFIIGSSTLFFDGSIDDVRMYNYVLSAQEVANLYSASAKKYTAAAPREGLVGWWTMDANDMSATGATLYDKSGQNNHGTVTGTTTSTGRINQARAFNGLTNSVNIGDKTVHRFTETTPFTLALWFKTTVGNQLKELIEKKSSSDLYRIIMQTDGSLYFEINDGTNNLVVNPTASLVNGIWHQAILTYDGVNLLTAYVDGVNIGTDNSPALSGVSTTSGNLTIGSGNNGTIEGSVDDVRVYSRALSAAEVAGLYESAKKNYVQ